MIKLYRGDCLEIMPFIPDKSIDMILCDLPYGTTACKWDSIIPLEKLWSEYKRLIKDNGAIVLFGSEPFSSYLRLSNIKDYKYDWVWNKKLAGNGINAKINPLKIHEFIHVFNSKIYYPQKTKGVYREKLSTNLNKPDIYQGVVNPKVVKNDEYYPKSIIEISIANLRRGRIHPTQKPVELGEYLIKTYTNENEIILDNCTGSGSFGVSAVNTNRNFIGIEKDCPKDGDKHFRTAIRRITEAGGRGIEVYE